MPQYRIKAIEAGRVSEDDGLVMSRYVSLLGIERWVKKWELAEGLVAKEEGAREEGSKRDVSHPEPTPVVTRWLSGGHPATR